MKKIFLLLLILVGITLLVKEPPIKAENKKEIPEIPYSEINIDFDKINQELDKSVTEIKEEKIETTKAIARLTKDNKALQKELVKISNEKQKVDTVVIIKHDTISIKVKDTPQTKKNLLGQTVIKNK